MSDTRCLGCGRLLDAVYEETTAIATALVLTEEAWNTDPEFNYYDCNDNLDPPMTLRCAYCSTEVNSQQYVWIMEERTD